MKVLLDIASVGPGNSYGPENRTGIFRVFEALAYELAASPDCDLSLCASGSIFHATAYAQSNPRLTGVAFPYAPYKQKISTAIDQLSKAYTGTSFTTEAISRLIGKSLWILDNTIGSTAHPLEPASLAQADVYHSTYQCVPEQAKNAKDLARFLTIYDLIPIKMPQFFRTKGVGSDIRLKHIFQSLGAEDYALCISQATKNDFCEYTGHNPNRAIVVHLAADAMLFYKCTNGERAKQVRQKYGVPERPYILGLSSLSAHKNIDHVIRCFAQLITEEKIDDLALVLAGNSAGTCDQVFQEINAASWLKERVVLTGRVDDSDLAALYSNAMAFVFMSHYEGFGLTPLEAMQCGVPVITSNNSSLPEVVGKAGILLDPNDNDGLCQAMLMLYQHEDLRREMSTNSLHRAQQFSWKRNAKETIAAYQNALSST